MWSGKKAQSAVEVSVLIFLIAIAMVGYVILLPAGERAALLGESNTTTTTTTTGTSILSESPGAVGPSKSTVQTRTLSPIRLYSTTNAVSKPLAASLTISRNLLQNNYKAITFNIDNPSDLQDLKLVFLASSHKGNLNIDLNGNTVFQGEVTSDKLPIVLPTDSLKAEGNVITLSTSLNWNLFSPNYYLLQDIQLLQGYTVADTSATRTFTVDDASQISSATLTYYITCNSDEKGVLTISMNDQEAFA
ncbi:hypothetical protein HZA98_03720, partial [Candidatus Woesearchaeota archaeon]|nr:hypothetical protein [Candidatus Woesearchaeota archaeon]